MLSSVKKRMGYKLKDLLFDDRCWTVRYLVAETNRLRDRQVLISPYALIGLNEDVQNIGIDLTKKQIEESPVLDTDRPVSQQFEGNCNGYCDRPSYWSGPDLRGAFMRDRNRLNMTNLDGKPWDPNLRSTNDLCGHALQAEDGVIGHVEDFIVDDETWAIRYLVISPRFWMPGKRVLISPQWIDRISWNESKVFVNVSAEAIHQSPEFTEDSLLTREYETSLFSYYHRKGYWIQLASTDGNPPLHSSEGE